MARQETAHILSFKSTSVTFALNGSLKHQASVVDSRMQHLGEYLFKRKVKNEAQHHEASKS
jgi:hypothetical protein